MERGECGGWLRKRRCGEGGVGLSWGEGGGVRWFTDNV